MDRPSADGYVRSIDHINELERYADYLEDQLAHKHQDPPKFDIFDIDSDDDDGPIEIDFDDLFPDENPENYLLVSLTPNDLEDASYDLSVEYALNGQRHSEDVEHICLNNAKAVMWKIIDGIRP